MTQSRLVLPVSPDPGSLRAWTYSHPDVSVIYRSALGHWLAGVVRYALAGGEPPSLGYAPARFLVPDFDHTGQTALLLESALGWLRETGFRPPGGEKVRAFQFVVGRRGGEVRYNRAVRGRLWGTLEPAESPSQLSVQVGFSLPGDEPEDTMHITIIGGRLGLGRSALVLSDLFPSALRRQPTMALSEMVGKGLPVAARGRWRGLVAQANRLGELDEVRSLVWDAYRQRRDFLGDMRGAMQRGIATDVLEAFEESLSCGLPSRRSESVTVASIDAMPDGVTQELLQVPGDLRVGAKLDEILPVLDSRSREVLRLRYEEDWTQQQIAEHLGLSQPMVHKIERQALEAVSRAIGHTPS